MMGGYLFQKFLDEKVGTIQEILAIVGVYGLLQEFEVWLVCARKAAYVKDNKEEIYKIVYKAFLEGKEYGISTTQPDAWDDGDADAFALSDACELLCRMQGRGE
jgi:hypothetical protein